MTETAVTIAAVLVFIIGPFWLIHRLDKRVARTGPLFSGRPTRATRGLALVIAAVLAGFALVVYVSLQSVAAVPLVLAFALVSYALGAERLLGRLQGRQHGPAPTERTERAIGTPEHGEGLPSMWRRILRLIGVAVAILLLSAVVIYAARWALTHLDSHLAWLFFAAAAAFIVMAIVLDLASFIRRLVE